MADFNVNNLIGMQYGIAEYEIIDEIKANYLSNLSYNSKIIYEFLGMARSIGWERSVEHMNRIKNQPRDAYDWASLAPIHEAYITRIDPPNLESTSGYKCSKCGSEFTTSYQKQTRSLDEGATTYVSCLAPGCGYRYRFS